MNDIFRRFANGVAVWTGTPFATFLAIAIVLIWLGAGVSFQFNNTYLAIGNTYLSLVSYVMLFFIQASQNRDSKIMSLKTDAILAALDQASNRLINLESQDDEIVQEISEEILSLRDLEED